MEENMESEVLTQEPSQTDREVQTELYTDAVSTETKEPEAEEGASEQNNLNRRIAEDFVGLKNEFPDEITDYASLPLAVKKAAATGVPLGIAYLVFRAGEQKRIAKAESAQNAASAASVGAVNSAVGNDASSEETRYRNALWRK